MKILPAPLLESWVASPFRNTDIVDIDAHTEALEIWTTVFVVTTVCRAMLDQHLIDLWRYPIKYNVR